MARGSRSRSGIVPLGVDGRGGALFLVGALGGGGLVALRDGLGVLHDQLGHVGGSSVVGGCFVGDGSWASTHNTR